MSPLLLGLSILEKKKLLKLLQCTVPHQPTLQPEALLLLKERGKHPATFFVLPSIAVKLSVADVLLRDAASVQTGKLLLFWFKDLKYCSTNDCVILDVFSTLWQLFPVSGSWVWQIFGARVKAARVAPHLGIAQSDGTISCEKIYCDGFLKIPQEYVFVCELLSVL